MSDDSCLVAKLSHYCELSDQDRSLLARLEEEEETFSGASDIRQIDDATNRLYVVKEGWLYSYIDTADGQRAIVQIHHPGDVVGLSNIAFTTAKTNLRSVEKCRLCPFPKTHLDKILEEAPRLTALLFTIALREHMLLVDKVRVATRMSARQRVAFLLLDLFYRLRITNPDMKDRYRLPLNQWQIGDTLGLTNVTISKALTQLRSDGIIAREGEIVILCDMAVIEELADHSDRYHNIDVSWFPSSGDKARG